MEKILIKTETINLDQLLKWASIVDSGGIVKFMIEDQLIKVNGEVVTQRRKKIYPGDIIEISEADLQKNGSNRIDRTNYFYEKITHYATAAVRALMPCSAVGYKK